MKLQEIHEVEQGIRPPESLKMTLVTISKSLYRINRTLHPYPVGAVS